MKHNPKAGFTLVEILAVLLILSILIGILMTSLFNASESANAKMTATRLEMINEAMSAYERDKGDYPPSTFDGVVGASGTSINRGIEAATRALYAPPFNGKGLSDDLLLNTDGDSLGGEELFELVDMWDNPIAYFRRQDYGKPQAYVTFDGETGVEVENEVQARKHPVTGRWANHQSFQLISAGSDGVFGTEDDIGNFKME